MTRRVLRWENPPASLTGRNGGREAGSQWDHVAKQLICNPGRSGVVLEGCTRGEATSLMGKINRGSIRCFEPAGEFQAVTRGTVKTGYAVYAWHVGGDE